MNAFRFLRGFFYSKKLSTEGSDMMLRSDEFPLVTYSAMVKWTDAKAAGTEEGFCAMVGIDNFDLLDARIINLFVRAGIVNTGNDNYVRYLTLVACLRMVCVTHSSRPLHTMLVPPRTHAEASASLQKEIHRLLAFSVCQRGVELEKGAQHIIATLRQFIDKWNSPEFTGVPRSIPRDFDMNAMQNAPADSLPSDDFEDEEGMLAYNEVLRSAYEAQRPRVSQSPAPRQEDQDELGRLRAENARLRQQLASDGRGDSAQIADLVGKIARLQSDLERNANESAADEGFLRDQIDFLRHERDAAKREAEELRRSSAHNDRLSSLRANSPFVSGIASAAALVGDEVCNNALIAVEKSGFMITTSNEKYWPSLGVNKDDLKHINLVRLAAPFSEFKSLASSVVFCLQLLKQVEGRTFKEAMDELFKKLSNNTNIKLPSHVFSRLKEAYNHTARATPDYHIFFLGHFYACSQHANLVEFFERASLFWSETGRGAAADIYKNYKANNVTLLEVGSGYSLRIAAKTKSAEKSETAKKGDDDSSSGNGSKRASK